MHIILLGPPGAGKGTQGDRLSRTLSLPKISTGDMLRASMAAGTPIGQKLKTVLHTGQLVPDEWILELVQERFLQSDCIKGALLDGFPRTVSQAQRLEQMDLAIGAVIEIQVPDEEIIERLSGRRIHAASGRTYHVKFNPPLVPGRDDITGEPLTEREDDKEAIIRKRLEVYHLETEPLIEWYQRQTQVPFIKIMGTGSPEAIHTEIVAALTKEGLC